MPQALEGRSAVRQAENDELLRRAQELPGVQEVLETYARVSRYANIVVTSETTVTHFATGGNTPLED